MSTILNPITEKEFTQQVVAIAQMRGWLVFHALPAQNVRGRYATWAIGDTGFPDLVLVHHTGGVVFAELKRSVREKARFDQLRWGNAIREGEGEWHLWTPNDMPMIIARLSNI